MEKGMYSQKLLEYFRNPKNVGEIPDADSKATEGSLVCGDMITVYLKIDKDSKVITDIKFQSYGCAANIAITSLMTEVAKGKTLEEAKKISFRQLMDMIGGLPPTKVHCSVLAIDGLRSAIRDYEEKQGLVTIPTVDESFIRSKLRHVMNPWLGRDVVSLGMVENIKIEEGKVEVTLDISKSGEFRNFILNEVKEKLSGLPNIKEVKIELVGEN